MPIVYFFYRLLCFKTQGIKLFILSKFLKCQRRSKSLPLGRSKSRPVCLIFGYVFWPLQGLEDIVRH
jgi:hypothetical protein